MKQQLTVSRADEFSYEILFREDFRDLNAALAKAGLTGRKICIVTDSHVAPLYAEAVEETVKDSAAAVTIFTLEAGEANKHLGTVQKLYEHLILHKFERKDYLLALGGGVVGDLTGFAAATYLRGIDFVQVPTTLLSQVDSSIGGKTGVDFLQYKNMVGAFHQPRLVYMNLSVLRSLPDVEFACGMGEVLKSGLIWDRTYYDWLLEHKQEIQSKEFSYLTQMIEGCCDIKRQVVEEDPTEQGVRAILNYGHTVGHAVEKLKDFQLLHGQCVGLGMLASAHISKARGLLSQAEFDRICQGIRMYGLPMEVTGLEEKEILEATKNDKKMDSGHVKFVLLKTIGEAYIDTNVTDEEILSGIRSILDGGKRAS
ncbi:MAG: 3-dehydroquinate synthase [Blautia sp.]|jgi:3-dehydroquinate synthase